MRDDELQACMDSLASMAHQLIATPRHVGPLAAQLAKRLAMENDQIAAEVDSKFIITGYLTLKTIPFDWGVVYLKTVSYLTQDGITSANGVEHARSSHFIASSKMC